nr:Chain P, Rationally designed V3 mimotope [synthetic construct]3MLS_Q Chain Q, Rationally designed V3 mimotope [synthetic construct]3MLS_R Chain R, Rationally designed V3 mimotope [synthetic construct]3MLS_S Chain S, Rationally designed V3 mimotope [synthetic construct]
ACQAFYASSPRKSIHIGACA